MAQVTTSLVVQFDPFAGDGVAGLLTAEIDARPDGFNNGRTQFVPGDSPAFLVFKSSNVEVTAVEVSAGNIAELGPVLIDVVDILPFPKVDEAEISKPYHSGLSVKWLGNSLGSVTLVGDTTLRVATPGVGVLKVSYKARALAYRISGLPTVLNGETSYVVLAVITGEAS